MSIKIGFYGSECYDLIHYCSRVLKTCGMSILQVDLSQDRSLEYSVPVPVGLSKDAVVDYRGVYYTSALLCDDKYNQDIIIYYFGLNEPKVQVDYGFVVTTTELHDINRNIDIKDRIRFEKQESQKDKEQAVYDSSHGEGLLQKYTPYLVILGAQADKRSSYIADEMSFPDSDTYAVSMEEVDYECRVCCQYETVFQFRAVSEEFIELINLICQTTLDCAGIVMSQKNYVKMLKKAERGR